MKSLSHADFKKSMLSNKKFKAAYDELEEEYQVINEMLRARKRLGLTQESIADRMKTTTSVISRLESLQAKSKHSPSLRTLKRYANALDCSLSIKFIPKQASRV